MWRLYSNIGKSEFVFYCFLISIFLFRIPNFNVIPFITTSLLSSHLVASFFVFTIFFLNVFYHLMNNKKVQIKLIILLISALFILQSLSVFSAINMVEFINRYFDIILGLSSFFVFYFYKSRIKLIGIILVFPFFINIGYQFFMLFFEDIFLKFAPYFIYDKHFSFITYNLDRSRIYIDSYDEAFIPLLFISGIIKSHLLRMFLLTSLFSLSLASGFRTRIIMVLFSTLSSLFIFLKNKKTIFLLIASMLILGFFINSLLLTANKQTFLDRFTLTNETEDVETIFSRTKQIEISANLAQISIFGVGLGNYYDNLLNSDKNIPYYYSQDRKVVTEAGIGYVHNIFATILVESGYLSLLIFIVIIALFIKDDIKTLQEKNEYKKAFTICFWTLMIYGLFNPNASASYQVFFWGIRGFLIR